VISRGETIVDVQLACDDPDIPDAEKIREWVVSAIAAADAAAMDRSEVSVRVVDVEEMQTLNREYRDKDEPTNVLSFPAGEITGLPDDEGGVLGDVVICAAIVRDEAVEQNKALADHWRHMLVHGTLHLLGYDHMTDAEATEMEGLEVRILTSLGVADPYRVQ
jgi:probable rRNA maturation factor